MRLNVDRYQRILAQKQISDAEVMKSTGLSERTYKWILENGFIECKTLERIADAVVCEVGEILKADPIPKDVSKDDKCTENVIEWIRDEKRATLSLSQRRTISRVKQLAEQYPEECQIVAENKDGSVCAHVPVSWVKISPPKQVSEKQMEHARTLYAKSHSTGYNQGQISTEIP